MIERIHASRLDLLPCSVTYQTTGPTVSTFWHTPDRADRFAADRAYGY